MCKYIQIFDIFERFVRRIICNMRVRTGGFGGALYRELKSTLILRRVAARPHIRENSKKFSNFIHKVINIFFNKAVIIE